jgi:hypothetical protein
VIGDVGGSVAVVEALLDGAGPVGEIETRGIEFEIEGVFLVDGAMGVEELVGNVAEDGGAAGGDASFGDEDE